MLWDELRQGLDNALKPWAAAQGLEALPAYTLENPPGEIDADIACNLAMILAKSLKKPPRILAQELQKTLESTRPDLIDTIQIAGAGFLNFKWTAAALQRELRTVLTERQRYGAGSVPG